MEKLLRFEKVEFSTNVRFRCRPEKSLPYPLYSIGLVPKPIRKGRHAPEPIPEIFWQ